MFNDLGEVGTFGTHVSRRIWPALGALGNVLDADGEVDGPLLASCFAVF
jgi:hypothetical protein